MAVPAEGAILNHMRNTTTAAALAAVLAAATAAALALAPAPARADGLTEDIAFDVVNNTARTITAVHITPPDDPSWGRDIATDYIAPGDTLEVDITDDLPDCEYDVLIRFSDGSDLDYGTVDLCRLNGQTVTVR